jgi:hypothetical protein
MIDGTTEFRSTGIYETTKERGATILMPISMVDSLNPYGNTLAVAIAGNEAVKSNGAIGVAELPRTAVLA